MRRILIPLDGTELAATIIPDARRLAGPDGELILVHDAMAIRHDRPPGDHSGRSAAEIAAEQLEAQAATLRDEGVKVRVQTLLPSELVWAIGAAAALFEVDMIACATHGRGPLGRLLRGSVAWKVLAQSSVPVLLRHPSQNGETDPAPADPSQRRILVPLDGSQFSEMAIPLAKELASEWHAPAWLVRIVSDLQPPDAPYLRWDMPPHGRRQVWPAPLTDLERIAQGFPGDVHTDVLGGPPIAGTLIRAARDRSITDIVMASHGRTGLSRVILGSVADELVQRLHCPMVIVPALAARAMGPEREQEKVGAALAR